MKQIFNGLIVAAALFTTSAQAVGFSTSFSTVDPGGAISYSFDDLGGNSLLLPITGGVIQPGTVLGEAEQPVGGIGKYWSIDPRNTDGTITFSTGLVGLSFLWGSPDSYNELSVALNGSSTFQAVGSNPTVESYFTITADAGEQITALKFRSFESPGFAFEVDNLRISPVPEPQTYAILLAGLGAIGFVARRRRVQS